MVGPDNENDFTAKCRLCLSQIDELVNLYPSNNFEQSSNKILEIIERFTTIKIHPSDQLPQKICVNCIQMIQTMQTFQNKCKRNDEKLRQLLAIKTEPEDYVEYVDYVEPNDAIENSGDCEATKFLEVNVDETVPKDEHNGQDQPSITVQPVRSVPTQDYTIKRKYLPRIPASDRLVPCHICGKRFNEAKLEYHMNVHEGLRPFVCDVENCTATFPSPRALKGHKRDTHKPKLLQCDVCGVAFKRKLTLSLHRTYHFEPSIPCKICEKLFRNRRALTVHMMVHSQERKFKCESCGKAFQTRYTLRTHKRIHTQEKPFSCECGVSFAYKCLLKAHMEKYHK